MKNPLIGIVGGKGKMGQYFADFFKQNGFEVIISDRDTKLSNAQLAKKADVVIVSVPIAITEQVISEVAPHVKKTGLLIDLTSLKVFPMKAMVACKGSYLGCHPMFGPTVSIAGQMAILCKGKGAVWYQWWKGLLLANQLEIKELTAKEHDHLMSYIQSLTHFSYLALADKLSQSGIPIDKFLDYQSPIYRLRLNVIGRILNQDPGLYAQIQIQNPDSLDVMEDFVAICKEWIEMVQKKDESAFRKKFEKASDYFGNFKKLAMEESDFLIDQMSRRKVIEGNGTHTKPDNSYDLVVLGPENTFSSMAAKKYNPKAKIYYAQSITEVFEIVEKGIVGTAMVPIENKLTGSVAETLDNLFDTNLLIQAEFYLPIHHYLVGLTKVDFKKIKTLYSHPQPIKQCKKYLKKHFPKAKFIQLPSTTAAVKELISKDLYDAAAICSEEAARAFHMTILDESIEDYAFNETRFLILSKQPVDSLKKKNKTSIVFYFSADAPGSLYQVLGELQGAGANMTKIESKANPVIPGGYVFYIDFEGSVENPSIKKMLSRIKKLVKKLKILGSY